ncbi:hypothetical protein [Escherichia phage UPEC03]|jgi:hypothetical protein|uniref:Uncharacterized protein n=9 Tax=root TaxID=1 RepID=K4F7K9_9CAUD|nr:hypothetical protein GAP161_051 [Cronobacter phage vB_CsaM_GAP161]YP_009831069.1 hypothetical protein HWB00_gp053 [Cronobacter phage vB_CsaM_leB]YP_009831349.1 hypothetical protein HWB01_gp053 [Cronobacter phage vB_CsaM_leE]AOG16459.1 hypothetical protein N_053 [Cronobacter phage vB_CsaM_leN]QJI53100.1 hypothetical protein EBPL_00057 [Enterobacter phage EBPL]QTJ24224.1 hypothetical protein [Enterobacter phage PF-CE2]QUL76983.1 hypothetical protein [Escherichia phage UPEC03]QVW27479.1 hypo
MKIKIDLNKILADANDEIDLLPYLVKLELQSLGIPIIIDPTDVRDPDFQITEGRLDYVINAETMIMEITYYERAA